MAIDFPVSPTVGQYFTSGTTTWQWDGSIWKLSPANYDPANLLPSQDGNSGKYLTTNGSATSWGSVPPSALTLISTTNFSGTTISIDNVFSSSFANYKVYISGVYRTSSVGSLYFRFRAGGSDITLTNYGYGYSATGTYYNYGATGNNYAQILPVRYNGYNGYNMYDGASDVTFYRPFETFNTAWTHLSWLGSDYASNDFSHGGGRYSANTSFTGFSFYHSLSGTITGRVSVYGITQ